MRRDCVFWTFVKLKYFLNHDFTCIKKKTKIQRKNDECTMKMAKKILQVESADWLNLQTLWEKIYTMELKFNEITR